MLRPPDEYIQPSRAKEVIEKVEAFKTIDPYDTPARVEAGKWFYIESRYKDVEYTKWWFFCRDVLGVTFKDAETIKVIAIHGADIRKGCSVLDCREPVDSKGMCRRHYNMWSRSGRTTRINRAKNDYTPKGKK